MIGKQIKLYLQSLVKKIITFCYYYFEMEMQVDEHSTDKAGSINNTVPSTSAETMQSPKSSQGSETGSPAPLGLGLAGLQPKVSVSSFWFCP